MRVSHLSRLFFFVVTGVISREQVVVVDAYIVRQVPHQGDPKRLHWGLFDDVEDYHHHCNHRYCCYPTTTRPVCSGTMCLLVAAVTAAVVPFAFRSVV